MEFITKELYRKLISDLEIEEGLKNSLTSFIDSYDGSNTKEFNEMLLQITGLLSRLGSLEAKAEGYEEIKKTQAIFEEELQELIDTALEIKDKGTDTGPTV